MRERLTADDRGVSEVVGAILVFGLLVVLLSIFQTQVVPVQNQEIEVQHSINVQGDLLNFHETASAVAADGSRRSVAIQSGTGYPPRLLFVNPPRTQGTISTTNTGPQVQIQGIEASNPDVNEYIDTGPSNQINIDTRRMQYQASYNELQDEPTIRYEYGILYSQFESGGLTIENEGAVIDGRNINILSLGGQFSESNSREQSLRVQPVSAPARSVTISGQGSSDITLVLPTNLPISEWQTLYDSNPNVLSISSGGPADTVEIVLDGSKQYTLRLSKIALQRGVSSPDTAYITSTGSGVTATGAGQDAVIEYEVRDEFNNPVSGAKVEVTDSNGNRVPNPSTTFTTDDQGRVSVRVPGTRTQEFTAEIVGSKRPSSCTNNECVADYRVQVPRLNLNPPTGVTVKDATTAAAGTGSTTSPVGSPLSESDADVTLESDSGSVGIRNIRINHYSPDPNGHNPPMGVKITDGTNSIRADIGGSFVGASSLDDVAPSGGTTYQFQFDESVNEGHYFVVTVIYQNDERALYFISPRPVGPGGPSPPSPPSP